MAYFCYSGRSYSNSLTSLAIVSISFVGLTLGLIDTPTSMVTCNYIFKALLQLFALISTFDFIYKLCKFCNELKGTFNMKKINPLVNVLGMLCGAQGFKC